MLDIASHQLFFLLQGYRGDYQIKVSDRRPLESRIVDQLAIPLRGPDIQFEESELGDQVLDLCQFLLGVLRPVCSRA